MPKLKKHKVVNIINEPNDTSKHWVTQKNDVYVLTESELSGLMTSFADYIRNGLANIEYASNSLEDHLKDFLNK